MDKESDKFYIDRCPDIQFNGQITSHASREENIFENKSKVEEMEANQEPDWCDLDYLRERFRQHAENQWKDVLERQDIDPERGPSSEVVQTPVHQFSDISYNVVGTKTFSNKGRNDPRNCGANKQASKIGKKERRQKLRALRKDPLYKAERARKLAATAEYRNIVRNDPEFEAKHAAKLADRREHRQALRMAQSRGERRAINAAKVREREAAEKLEREKNPQLMAAFLREKEAKGKLKRMRKGLSTEMPQ